MNAWLMLFALFDVETASIILFAGDLHLCFINAQGRGLQLPLERTTFAITVKNNINIVFINKKLAWLRTTGRKRLPSTLMEDAHG